MCFNTYSQIGIRGGVNFSNLKFDDKETAEYKMSMLKEKKAGYHVGIMGRVTLFGIFIQPEILFNSATNTFELVDLVSNTTSEVDQKFNKLSIPVVVGKKLKFLRLGVGPVATVLLTSDSELKDVTNYKEEFKNATFGYQLDLGIDIKDLAIDFKYEGNLSRFGEGINIGGEERKFDSRERQFIVSVGYFF